MNSHQVHNQFSAERARSRCLIMSSCLVISKQSSELLTRSAAKHFISRCSWQNNTDQAFKAVVHLIPPMCSLRGMLMKINFLSSSPPRIPHGIRVADSLIFIPYFMQCTDLSIWPLSSNQKVKTHKMTFICCAKLQIACWLVVCWFQWNFISYSEVYCKITHFSQIKISASTSLTHHSFHHCHSCTSMNVCDVFIIVQHHAV